MNFWFLDKFSDFMSGIYEKGYLFYIIPIILILLLVFIGLSLFIWIENRNIDDNSITNLIAINGLALCKERGYNNYNWVNQSIGTFKCVNSSGIVENPALKYLVET